MLWLWNYFVYYSRIEQKSKNIYMEQGFHFEGEKTEIQSEENLEPYEFVV